GQRGAREIGGRLGLGRRRRRRRVRRRRRRANRQLVGERLGGGGLRRGRGGGGRRRDGHRHLRRRPPARLRLGAMSAAPEPAEQRDVRGDAHQEQQRQAPPAGRVVVVVQGDLAGHLLHRDLCRNRSCGEGVVIGRRRRVVIRRGLRCEQGAHVITVPSPRPAKRGEG